MSLANKEFDEVKCLLDRLAVWVATTEDLLINFVWDRTPIFIQLLALLLDFAVVSLDVVHEGVNELNLFVQAEDERFSIGG